MLIKKIDRLKGVFNDFFRLFHSANDVSYFAPIAQFGIRTVFINKYKPFLQEIHFQCF